MKVKLYWTSDRQKTLIAEFAEKWEITDLAISVGEMHQMIREVRHDVCLVIWHRVVPPTAQVMRYLNQAFKTQPENTRRVIVIPYSWSSGVTLIATWVNIIEKLHPSKAKVSIVKTYEDAMRIAEEIAVMEPAPASKG